MSSDKTVFDVKYIFVFGGMHIFNFMNITKWNVLLLDTMYES